jgi:hypothetical protein
MHILSTGIHIKKRFTLCEVRDFPLPGNFFHRVVSPIFPPFHEFRITVLLPSIEQDSTGDKPDLNRLQTRFGRERRLVVAGAPIVEECLAERLARQGG